MGNDVSQKGQQCHCDCNDGHTSGDFDDLCTDTDKLMCDDHTSDDVFQT